MNNLEFNKVIIRYLLVVYKLLRLVLRESLLLQAACIACSARVSPPLSAFPSLEVFAIVKHQVLLLLRARASGTFLVRLPGWLLVNALRHALEIYQRLVADFFARRCFHDWLLRFTLCRLVASLVPRQLASDEALLIFAVLQQSAARRSQIILKASRVIGEIIG